MLIQDPEAYVDAVAQAVIDRIEERERLNVLVEAVAHRVLAILEEERQQRYENAAQPPPARPPGWQQ